MQAFVREQRESLLGMGGYLTLSGLLIPLTPTSEPPVVLTGLKSALENGHGQGCNTCQWLFLPLCGVPWGYHGGRQQGAPLALSWEGYVVNGKAQADQLNCFPTPMPQFLPWFPEPGGLSPWEGKEHL